jgi:hypothetical protein
MAGSAVDMLEGRFGPRRRPIVLMLFDGSCTLRWWLTGKALLWAWCSALVRVRVQSRETLITFYPHG